MIGALMLALTFTGLLDRLQSFIPVLVGRGIQAGLGIALARTALGLTGREGTWGWVAAAVAVALLVWLRRHHHVQAPCSSSARALSGPRSTASIGPRLRMDSAG